MLDPKFVLENLESVQNRLAARGPRISLDELVRVSRDKKDVLKKAEDLRAVRNKASEEVSRLKKAGQDASAIIAEMRTVGDEIAGLEERLKTMDEEIRSTLLNLPNVPHDSVPVGKSSEDNVEVRRWGGRPEFGFKPQAHWDVGEKLGILDFERAAKITGSRFTVYFGPGARLERALIDFMLDLHTRERGFTEVLPPFIANAESLTGTGNLPKFKEDLFKLEGFDWYLIPTAEVPLTNIYRDEILDGGVLPTPLRGLHAVLPQRGRLLRQGRPRPHPPAPVQQGRDDDLQPAGDVLRRARVHDRLGRGGPEAARPAPPGRPALHRRHGLRQRQDLRPRGLDAQPERLHGDLLLLELPGLPGPPGQYPVQARGQGPRPSSSTPSTARGWPSAGP